MYLSKATLLRVLVSYILGELHHCAADIGMRPTVALLIVRTNGARSSYHLAFHSRTNIASSIRNVSFYLSNDLRTCIRWVLSKLLESIRRKMIISLSCSNDA